MITIKKSIFKNPSTIPEILEVILSQGVQESFKLSQDQIKWTSEFIDVCGSRIVHLSGDRRTGRTSVGIGMLLTTALFKDNTESMMMTYNKETARYALQKTLDYIRLFCEIFSLPEIVKSRSQNKITLINGSTIHFSKKSENSLRGCSLDNLFLDFNSISMESLDDEFMSVAIPSISGSDGKMIISIGE